jgi:uncharacterized protein (TIGR03000 family)
MYSVVLMMAMTSGGNVADFGHRHGGCCGGEAYSSCCGGSYAYSSCCGGSYGDCCGGGRHHHRRSGHRHGGCCGGESYGSCSGYSAYSGCCGGYVAPADCGCGAAVYTGCTGGTVTGGAVIGGENAEPIGPGHDGHEHHATTGGEVKAEEITAEERKQMDALIEANPDQKAAITAYYKGASHADRKKYYNDNKPAKKDETKPEDVKKPKKEVMVPAPATIIVSLPADATLTIDDAATTSTASPRVFTSPVLPAGRDFHYTLKAQIVRDGKTVEVSKEVTVRAGQTTRATMEAGLASVASR